MKKKKKDELEAKVQKWISQQPAFQAKLAKQREKERTARARKSSPKVESERANLDKAQARHNTRQFERHLTKILRCLCRTCGLVLEDWDLDERLLSMFTASKKCGELLEDYVRFIAAAKELELPINGQYAVFAELVEHALR
jgi:hypothetical protein